LKYFLMINVTFFLFFSLTDQIWYLLFWMI